MSTRRRTFAVLGIVLALVLLVSLNVFAALELRPVRLDVTEDRAFTLSEGTRELLAKIEEPISLRLYVSRAVRERDPLLASYADRVLDFLKTYAEASNGRIRVEYVDPEPYSEEEDRAMGFGLRPIQLDAETTGYFGLAGINSTDDVGVIPVLAPDRERFLEYDITRLVYQLAYPEKPVVALLSGLPVNADPQQQFRPWQIYELLKQEFDVRWMAGDVGKFDDDVNALLLIHPQGLSERTLYAIDQFVLSGRPAMILVDPHSEAQMIRQRQPGMADTASTLARLFDAWGISYDKDRIVVDPVYARQVQIPSGQRPQVLDYLAWLSLTGDALDRKSPVTAELERINVASAGAIEAKEGAPIRLEPLLVSSPQAQLVDAETQRLFPDPVKLLRDYRPDGRSYVLAALVTGQPKSAFPDGPPEGAEASGEPLKQAVKDVRLVVVADTDLLDDRMWLLTQRMLGQEVTLPIAHNGSFVANALDWLAGSEVLTKLRGRKVALRPFDRLVELRKEAEQRYRAKEQELVERLQELEKRLRELDLPEQGQAEGAVIPADVQEQIARLRQQILDTRRELREVRRRLQEDIERLQATVRFANIGLVPLLVAVVAVIVGLVRRARMRAGA